MSDDNGTAPVPLWEKHGLSLRERHRHLLRRYNGLVRACEKQNQFVDELLGEKDRLGKIVQTLAAEVTALQSSKQALGARINDASDSAVEEVLRLRKLLKANQIPIGG